MHVQKPSVHTPFAPHCVFVEHVPQVPATHAIAPPHWLLAVQLVHTPLMHAKPLGGCGAPSGWVLQSMKVEHGPQTLLMQACPMGQPLSSHPVMPGEEHRPEEHVSPAAQSVLRVQVHCIPMCVAVHWALGPHCAFDVHVVHI